MSDNHKGQYLKAAADVMTLKERIKQLEQELADAKKDQARYQWIVRDFNNAELKLDDYLYTDFESLDDFIDTAMKESSK